MRIPTHPIIVLQLTQVLMRQYKLDGVTASRTAEDLIHAMADAELFVVKGNWMNSDWRPGKFSWSDIPVIADEFEDRKPWFPDGYSKN